jgi:hypothetical protein
MNISFTTIIGARLLFLFIFLSGYWLSKMGKPYSSFPFNIHKLIGLAAGVFLIMTVVRRNQAAPIDSPAVTILTVTAGGILRAVDNGRLSSLSQPIHTAISLIHKLFPYPAVFFTIATLDLLMVH